MGTEAAFDMTDVMVSGKRIRGIVQGDSAPERFIPELVDLYLAGKFPMDA